MEVRGNGGDLVGLEGSKVRHVFFSERDRQVITRRVAASSSGWL